jgi:hypothetical protein
VVVAILDIVFELNPHLPKKARILQRIRQATGQPDPDKGPDPAQQAKQQKQEQMQAAEFEAKLSKLQADVAEARARGEKLTADAFAVQLSGLHEAAQAAQVIAMTPHLAPVMDELAKSAGFVDRDGQSIGLPQAGPMQAAQQPMLPAEPAPIAPDGAQPGAMPIAGA